MRTMFKRTTHISQKTLKKSLKNFINHINLKTATMMEKEKKMQILKKSDKKISTERCNPYKNDARYSGKGKTSYVLKLGKHRPISTNITISSTKSLIKFSIF